MKKIVFFIAIMAILGVNRSNAQYATNASGYNITMFPGGSETISLIGDEDGFSTWTSDNHGLLGTNAAITVTAPDQYRKVGKASGAVVTPFNVSIVNPTSVSVSGNDIIGIHTYFAGGGGGNRVQNSAGITVGTNQTSYTGLAPDTYTVRFIDAAGQWYEETAVISGPTQYLVTVNSGTGGGNFAQGATVNISASTPPAGQQFKNWTTSSNGVSFADANSASTTFTMPANAVTVTANYEPIPVTTYTLTVNSGTGSGNYAQGATVNISASAPPAGQQFKNWTTSSNGVSFADANSASTTFTMPANAVTVTANYELETAVEVVETQKTVVYPSGEGQVTVKSNSSIEGVWIYALIGQLEKTVTVRSNEIIINDLPRGQVLVMKVAVNGNIKTFKVVLK